VAPSGSHSSPGRGNGYAESCSPESPGPLHCGSSLSARFGLVRVTTIQACVHLPPPRFLARRVGRSGFGFSTLPPWLVPFPRLSRLGTRGGPSLVHLQGGSCPHSDIQLSEREETSFSTPFVLLDSPGFERTDGTHDTRTGARRSPQSLRATRRGREEAPSCVVLAQRQKPPTLPPTKPPPTSLTPDLLPCA
jgi:hypothetical protein